MTTVAYRWSVVMWGDNKLDKFGGGGIKPSLVHAERSDGGQF